ncbi:hypothetical protein LXL04_016764 [Taraxacum kok-saghyz]
MILDTMTPVVVVWCLETRSTCGKRLLSFILFSLINPQEMAILLDPLLSESISSLFKAVIFAAQTTVDFKPQLQQLTTTLQTITPIIEETVKLNRELDCTELECKMFIDKI